MADPTWSGVRVFPELRQAHIEEIVSRAPRTTLYFDEKYDLDPASVPAACVPTTLLRAVRFLWSSDERVLELPEPLWLRFLPRWGVLAITWKLRRFRRGGGGTEVVFFAIENNTVDKLLPQALVRGRPARDASLAALRFALGHLVSRCAFGTSAAADTYAECVPASVQSEQVLDLLAPREAREKEPGSVVFLGSLEHRKGVDLLMRAWPAVEASNPGARLTVIGRGPLEQEVRAWADARPTSRAYLGALPREQALEVLSTTSVLAAPSVPEGRWREQVGRPIQEALAAGTTVVTTDETGLASFLLANGHRVVAAERVSDQLPAALAEAIARPIDPAEVRAALPEQDGRLVADRWLHG
jgi:glycosyltransferase involved in cell wall biosynthesis